MTGVGGDTGRGVRVAARSLRTWRRLVERAIFVTLVSALIAGSWKTWSATTSHDWHVMGVYALAGLFLAADLSPGRSKTLRLPDGRVVVTTIGEIVAFEPILAIRDRILGDALDAALLGGGICAAVVIAGLVALRTLGSGLRRGRRLRGGELVRRAAARTPFTAPAPTRPAEDSQGEAETLRNRRYPLARGRRDPATPSSPAQRGPGRRC